MLLVIQPLSGDLSHITSLQLIQFFISIFVAENHVYKQFYNVMTSVMAYSWCKQVIAKRISNKYCHGNIYVQLACKTAVLNIENIKISDH